MIILYTLLLLLFLLIFIDLTRGIRVKMHAVITRDTMSMTFTNSLIRATVDMNSGVPHLSVYLLKLKLFTSKIARSKSSNLKRIVRSLKISNFDIFASYGFRDPSLTGLVSGMLGILSSFICIRNLDLAPNFMSDEQYALVDASANIKMGHTIWDYLKT